MIYQTATKILQNSGEDPVATMQKLEDTVRRLSITDRFLADVIPGGFSAFDYDVIYKQYIPELIFDSPINADQAKELDLPEWELIDLLINDVSDQEMETTDTIIEKVKNFEDFKGKDILLNWLESIRE